MCYFVLGGWVLSEGSVLFSVHRSESFSAVPFLFNYRESHKCKEEMYWTLILCFILTVKFYAKHSLLQEIFGELNSSSAHNVSTMDTKFAQCM